jgi:glycosyltransferase involved in cell wall biosynthesis
MSGVRIVSPMSPGSGAYVVHHLLEDHIAEYHVARYNPYWTFFPFILPTTVYTKDANLMHTTPDYAFFFYRKSIPLIITFHNYVLDQWMWSHSSILQCIHYATDLSLWTRLAVHTASRMTAVSHFTAGLVKRKLGIAAPVQVIHNGVDASFFTPSSVRNSREKQLNVLFSGNLIRRKGAHWLAHIAKRIGKNICIYYTQGLRTRNDLEPDPHLKPIGPVPFKEMPGRYRDMDILLLPTVREGLSLAVLEAMSSGLPVVASDCSSLPEQIDDGRGGFLCPIGDVDAFADKINFLAESPKLRQEMGEYNRARVEKHFTLERMIEEYKNLFEEALSAS